eukprot:Nitzschia sp. Nitz4//scaffold8_size234185//129530//130672//NITZ4_001269-RA/size234185-processed-gene-0.118-mRNA-1//1//CDS//3329559842//375//frame0
MTDSTKTEVARMVSLDQMEQCGQRLREGGLVAFPTETVYGLGGNALDPQALQEIFRAKERPLTDPIIAHVSEFQTAFDLWHAQEQSLEHRALQSITKNFWPGPLTLVAKAAPSVPPILMANTGFVACRAPQHPVAIALIQAAKVPIAAPSANKFGHVSPTRPQHVWDDLKYEDVWIVDPADQIGGVCQVGVESSVVKIEMEDNEKGRIIMLRQGAVDLASIQRGLVIDGLASSFGFISKTQRATDDTVANVAPGQTIRHYSPDIPSYMLSHDQCGMALSPRDIQKLSTTIVIDFRGKLAHWKDHAMAYRELCSTGDSAEATKSVFETLRWAERVAGAERIIFPQIVATAADGDLDALTLALKDRLTRAASGVVVDSIVNL